MEKTSNALGMIADNSAAFSLVSPTPGEHEEQILLSVLNNIEQEHLARSRRHGKKQSLLCFSAKLTYDELRTLQDLSKKWKLPQTYLARFLLRAVMPLLQSPTEAVRPALEAYLAAEIAREEARERKRQKKLAEFAA
jgi:hypothetical protein